LSPGGFSAILKLSHIKEDIFMDIKGMLKDKLDDIVDKIKSDKNIAAKFQKDPVGTVEELLGVDLPNDQLENLVDMIKTKLKLEKAGDALGGLGKLFGK
jgi:hypothetical protein